jgi:S1-C subfamily serine protease
LVATREFSPTPADTEVSADRGSAVDAATVVLSTNTPIAPVLTETPTLLPPTLTSTPAPSATVTFSPEVSQGVADVRGSNTDTSSADPLSQSVYVGITVEDTSMGLKIINTNSNAQTSGVQIGDYILGIGSDMITTRAQFVDTMSAHKPSSHVSLYLWRGGRINIVTLVLGVNDFSLATGIP